MDICKWRESYETGIESMDNQHKTLIEIINRLYRVMRDTESQVSVKDVLEEMNNYAENHFQEEEKLLKESNYPEYEKHADLHQKYREKLQVLMDESKMKDSEWVQESYTFLRQWWMEHIVGEDGLYGEFIASKTSD